MEINFEWVPRYSDTDKFDVHGRWSRLCYVNGILIGWVNKLRDVGILKEYYTSRDFFPSNGHPDPLHVGAGKNFETLKEGLEKRFIEFVEKIK